MGETFAFLLGSVSQGQHVSADDAFLVRRSLRGDSQAIEDLVWRFQSDVFGLCVRLLHNRHDAEDVTQETFLRVFRSLKRWDSSLPLKPWIMGIAVNRCRTWMNQRSRRPEPVPYLHETAAGPVEDDALADLYQKHGKYAEAEQTLKRSLGINIELTPQIQPADETPMEGGPG